MSTEATNEHTELDTLRATIALLRDENNSLAQQLGHAFEEMTLFQQLASQLALPNHTTSLSWCAERLSLAEQFGDILDHSLEIIEGESIGLLIKQRDEVEIVCSVGEPLSIKELTPLLTDTRQNSRTFGINNHVSEQALTSDAIQHCIVAPLNSDGHHYGWLVAINRIGPNGDEGFTSIEGTFLGNVASMIAVYSHNTSLLCQSRELFTDMVRALVSAVDARDPYTCGHSERVGLLARELADAAGRSADDRERLYFCGLLHDVGKIGVPDAILRKQEALDESERSVMSEHPENGWRILQNVAALASMLPGVLHHHESLDGTGYPEKLEGNDIPFDARLLAICDSFDAMTSDRPYRKGMPIEKAARILQQGAGTQWDAELVAVFLANIGQMEQVVASHSQASRVEPHDVQRV